MEPSPCQASQEPSQQDKCPSLWGRPPACCLRGAGLVPSRSVPSGSFPAPLPPPCPKASCRREPYGPLWTHFPSTVSSWCECEAWRPSISCPPQPDQEVASCWGASPQNRGALCSQSEWGASQHPRTENS